MSWCRLSKGLLITFEGIDACGKSTQIARASQYLIQKGVSCIITREPGGTPIAEDIRKIILSPQNHAMRDSCEVLLYLAARAQHIEEKIVPALEAGKIVLCDRFQEATFAYQGFGRGFPLDILTQLNSFATRGTEPARTYIFDIGIEIAFARMEAMGKQKDRLETNAPEFYQRIREGYLALASAHSNRIKLLPGEKSIEELYAIICNDLDTLLAVHLYEK